MTNSIQDVFQRGYAEYCRKYKVSSVQRKAATDIMKCKTGELGYFVYTCSDCGYTDERACSCRNRHCPSCQSIPRERWIDERKSEVFDESQYFHIIMTIPQELNQLFYLNQDKLYPLLHLCSSQCTIELSRSSRGMGGTPCVTQVLHTWGRKLNYHPHIHSIVSGIGLSKTNQLVRCKEDYLFPLSMLMEMFRGKLLYHINDLYLSDSLLIPQNLRKDFAWSNLMSKLHYIDWAPYIKETFNGNGNAIDYLGRYTYHVAISNSRIKEVSDTHVTFKFFDFKTQSYQDATITLVEFIYRYLRHVLPKGMQKIRYSGLLNNRFKNRNLQLLSILLHQKRRKAILKDLNMAEILKQLWSTDITICPQCHGPNLRLASRPFHLKL